MPLIIETDIERFRRENNISLPFQHQPTLDRRNESYNSIQPVTISNQLKKVIECLTEHPNLSSRQIAEITGMDRTSITGRLAENKNLFDVTKEFRDPKTNKRVTLYKIK